MLSFTYWKYALMQVYLPPEGAGRCVFFDYIGYGAFAHARDMLHGGKQPLHGVVVHKANQLQEHFGGSFGCGRLVEHRLYAFVEYAKLNYTGIRRFEEAGEQRNAGFVFTCGPYSPGGDQMLLLLHYKDGIRKTSVHIYVYRIAFALLVKCDRQALFR